MRRADVTRYMVVERFRDGAAPVYARLADRGRMLPEGLRFLDSWPNREAGICFQLMETDAPALFDIWTARWCDLVDFEIHEVDRA